MADENIKGDNKSLLTTQRDELIKQYIVFDVEDRPEFVYTAHTEATHGQPCTQVQYVYVGPGSALVSKMKESRATWDATWDI